MPLLRQVLPECFFSSAADHGAVADFLDVAVKEVRLNTGSPCDGHSAMFGDWPGAGANVRQWFILENGKAVAVDEDPDDEWRYPIVDYEG